jgi:hypothetical protein
MEIVLGDPAVTWSGHVKSSPIWIKSMMRFKQSLLQVELFSQLHGL